MLLIFDCDGVLVDSEVLSCTIDAELLTELGVPYTAQEIAQQFLGVSLKTMISRIEAERGCRLPPSFSERLNRTLFARFETDLKPIQGVREAVLSLPYPRCVASSSVPERIALSLRVTGLADLFLHAANHMGARPEECIVIEDSPAGIQAALAAGIRVIGFVGGGHCGPEHADKLRKAGAPVIVERMADLSFAIEH